jgi:hypothetical protein
VTSDLVGCEISVGSIAEILARAGDALAEVHTELVRYMHGVPALNIDETSWRGPAGKRWWCWGAVHRERRGVPAASLPRQGGRDPAARRGPVRDRLLGSLLGLRAPGSRPPSGMSGAFVTSF